MRPTTLSFDASVEPPATLHESLSGIFGSVSLVAWLCLLLPQLIANYKTKNAEALSMGFLFIWLGGDLANLAGAFLTSLSPTAVILGVYFVIADTILISQTVYYNARSALRRGEREGRRRRESANTISSGEDTPSEDSPLLQRSSSIGLPGSHRLSGHHQESGLESLRKVITGEDETVDTNPWLHNTLGVLGVWIVGLVAWFITYRYGMWDSSPTPDLPDDEAGTLFKVGTALGYFSAVCYLCARLPQIYKNWKEQSCEGLALLFFLLSMTGNSTYGLSLLAYSRTKADFIKAIPWLAGSLGTVFEDFVIFIQFRLYSRRE